jgi:hypothetical protein
LYYLGLCERGAKRENPKEIAGRDDRGDRGMSNKRIRKKWAKAEMQRDKSKVIASLIVMLDSDKPRYEQLKIAKMLWKMSLEELFDFSERAIRAWVCYHSPLRPMIPCGNAGELVNWHSVLSNW